jgi:hypothetical protein
MHKRIALISILVLSGTIAYGQKKANNSAVSKAAPPKTTQKKVTTTSTVNGVRQTNTTSSAPQKATTTAATKNGVRQTNTALGAPKTANSTATTSKSNTVPKITSMEEPKEPSHAVLSQGPLPAKDQKPGPVLSQGGPVLSQPTKGQLVQARYQALLKQRHLSYYPLLDFCAAARNSLALQQARYDVLGSEYLKPREEEVRSYHNTVANCRLQDPQYGSVVPWDLKPLDTRRHK